MLHSLAITPTVVLLTYFASTAVAIAPYTQSCHATDNIFSDSPKYRVEIGITFAGGEGCPGVKDALSKELGDDFGGFTCKDNGEGDTSLSFECYEGRGADINKVLEAMYPEVNGFNCPDS